MQRRSFIQGMTACAAIPAGALPALCDEQIPRGRTYAFVDQRFGNARRIAASWAPQPIAVHADVTSLWTAHLHRDARRYCLHLKGVTTGSFLFCLRILAQEYATVVFRASRVDRDVFVWTMDTAPVPRGGSLHA